MRYMNNYSYNPNVLSYYSSDLRLLDTYLAKSKAQATTTRVVTTKDELPFYTLVARYDKRFTASLDIAKAPQTIVMTHDAYTLHRTTVEPYRIITNRKSHAADRLYIYTTKQ